MQNKKFDLLEVIDAAKQRYMEVHLSLLNVSDIFDGVYETFDRTLEGGKGGKKWRGKVTTPERAQTVYNAVRVMFAVDLFFEYGSNPFRMSAPRKSEFD